MKGGVGRGCPGAARRRSGAGGATPGAAPPFLGETMSGSGNGSSGEALRAAGPRPDDGAGGGAPPSVATAVIAFLATLGGKSPRTEHTYGAGLDRFQEFLAEEGLPPGV